MATPDLTRSFRDFLLAGGLVFLVLQSIMVDASRSILNVAATSIVGVVSDAWVWPSDFVQDKRRERIRQLREEARRELWVSRNLIFQGGFSEPLKEVFRRHHRENAVLLELQARRLEKGWLVRKYPPAKWYDNVFVYPMDLNPSELPGLSVRDAKRKPIVLRNEVIVSLDSVK